MWTAKRSTSFRLWTSKDVGNKEGCVRAACRRPPLHAAGSRVLGRRRPPRLPLPQTLRCAGSSAPPGGAAQTPPTPFVPSGVPDEPARARCWQWIQPRSEDQVATPDRPTSGLQADESSTRLMQQHNITA